MLRTIPSKVFRLRARGLMTVILSSGTWTTCGGVFGVSSDAPKWDASGHLVELVEAVEAKGIES